MPIPVQNADAQSLEHQAYELVADIETQEMNDRNRLGYHVYLFMTGGYPTFREAFEVAQARLKRPPEEIFELLAGRLRDRGYTA